MIRRFRTIVLAAFALTLSLALAPAAGAAETGTIRVRDAYLAIARPNAASAAAYMMLVNEGTAADRLIGVTSDLAARIGLHSHIAGADGVMRMREVEAGFDLPAGGAHMLAQGRDHLMIMGLTRGIAAGDEVTLTLIFEAAGEITVTLPVAMAGERPQASHSN